MYQRYKIIFLKKGEVLVILCEYLRVCIACKMADYCARLGGKILNSRLFKLLFTVVICFKYRFAHLFPQHTHKRTQVFEHQGFQARTPL